MNVWIVTFERLGWMRDLMSGPNKGQAVFASREAAEGFAMGLLRQDDKVTLSIDEKPVNGELA